MNIQTTVLTAIIIAFVLGFSFGYYIAATEAQGIVRAEK